MNDSSEIVKVVFAGGGTGGHIYPGLAAADSLRSLCDKNGKKIQIYWIGNSKGMDRRFFLPEFPCILRQLQ